MFNPKDIKKIKEIITWLNKEFAEWRDNDDRVTFKAFHPRGSEGSYDAWHVCCNNYMIYAGKDFKRDEFEECMEAIKTKFPKLKIVFCYLHDVSLKCKQKHMSKSIVIK